MAVFAYVFRLGSRTSRYIDGLLSALSCFLAMGQTFSVTQIIKLLTYGFWLSSSFWCSDLAWGQGFEPLTPEPENPEVPPLLPPEDNPLESLPTPPIPESVLDIPGAISVKQFSFTGNTVFEAAELNRELASFTQQPVSFAQLVQAANRITALYVSEGYITTGAYIPEQSLDSDTVEIQIVEGSLGEIAVEVEGRLNPGYVRDRLVSRIDQPLNINQLQSALQLIQLNPLIEDLTAELAAGITPGTNILRVTVNSADTFSIRAKLNNNRNTSIGTFERGLQLEEGNLLGIGDRFRLTYDNTDGSNQFGGGYTFPLNARDGTLGVNFRWGKNEIIQSSFEEIDIDIRTRNYGLTWRQPLWQKATPEVSQELAFGVTAARRESDGTIMDEPQPLTPGADEEGEIRTSVISLEQEWLQRNRQQVISARSQFNFGIDVLDATVLEDEPDSQFFSWRGQFSYLRSLGRPQRGISPTVLLRSELQLAAEALISTEQFSLGGATTVRGYRQDALLSDSGFLAAAEFRLPVARFEPVDATLQFAPFIDFGTGWNNDAEELEFSTLIGTGFGLLLQTPERFSARFDWGIPLINSDDQGSSLQEDGVYLQLEYSFF
ncbi:MAG: ShlB/FhaC/HecB family hemolysin secretion/activation protein [Cyanobacteria bacterium J06588_4]